MGLLEFGVGAVAIAVPQYSLPLLVASLAVKGIQHVKHRRELKAAESELDLTQTGTMQRVKPARLSWSHLNCSLTPKSKKGQQQVQPPKRLLKNLHGTAKPGRLLAIMGPSGSGKTTLLNALSGQLPRTDGMKLTGYVTINGVSAAQSAVRVAYVQQEDMFYSQLTVRETLEMAAALRLSKHSTAEQRAAVVDAVMQKLGLTKVADTIVGDQKTRGISGGEKKRLSIGCELISSPSLIFVDEPTTGLDAFQAQKVMESLKQLADDGHTVVASIHQPRSSIYEMFDDLLLMSDGSPVYFGPANQALNYFAQLDHPCPEHYNPAEFLADLISIDFSTPQAEQETRTRVEALLASTAAIQSGQASKMTDDEDVDTDSQRALTRAEKLRRESVRVGFWRQFRLLFRRSWRQVARDKATLKVRAATTLQAAAVFGMIWWKLKLVQPAIQSRLGLLQVAVTYLSQTTLFKALNLFPPEKNLVQAERAKHSYDAGPYFLAKLLAEVPLNCIGPLLFSSVVYPMTGLQSKTDRFLKFLGVSILEAFASTALGLSVGATAPSTDVALVLGPAVMLVFIVFGGLYINTDTVPAALRWLPKISMVKAGYEALAVNEMRGLAFVDGNTPGSLRTGDQVLDRIGFGNSTVKSAAGALGRFVLMQYWITYNLLRSKQPQYQPLEEPVEA